MTKALPFSEGTSINLSRMEGTCTTAKISSPLLFTSLTAILRLLFASRGKGLEVSTARGVRTGKRNLSKYSSTVCFCILLSSFILRKRSLHFLSAGIIERWKQEYCFFTKRWIFAVSSGKS